MLKALARCPRVPHSLRVTMCLSLFREGDLLHPCAVFDRKTCSRLQACRRSWSRSLTAWTPAFLRQSVSFHDESQLCLGEFALEKACHLYLAEFLAGMGSPWSLHNPFES